MNELPPMPELETKGRLGVLVPVPRDHVDNTRAYVEARVTKLWRDAVVSRGYQPTGFPDFTYHEGADMTFHDDDGKRIDLSPLVMCRAMGPVTVDE